MWNVNKQLNENNNRRSQQRNQRTKLDVDSVDCEQCELRSLQGTNGRSSPVSTCGLQRGEAWRSVAKRGEASEAQGSKAFPIVRWPAKLVWKKGCSCIVKTCKNCGQPFHAISYGAFNEESRWSSEKLVFKILHHKPDSLSFTSKPHKADKAKKQTKQHEDQSTTKFGVSIALL